MSQLLGIPSEFEFSGKHYQVCPRDFYIEALMAEWVKSEAAIELWKLKATAPPEFYADQNRIYADKLHSKQFKWGTATVHPAYWSDEGQRHILWLKIKRGREKGGENIERATIDEIAKDKEKWQQLCMIMWEQDEPDFFKKLKEEEEAMKANQPAPNKPLSSPADSTSTM